jgi:hypothetical protein
VCLLKYDRLLLKRNHKKERLKKVDNLSIAKSIVCEDDSKLISKHFATIDR